jgi:voltage-gated potassium channel
VPANEPIGARGLVHALQKKPLTARRAAVIIASFTCAVTVIGGLFARLADHKDFHTLGDGLWWSLQTVTTVGYGDIVPRNTSGRFIGAIVMLTGIGFLTVITASVTAALIESVRRRMARAAESGMAAQLDEIGARLTAIEAGLAEIREPPQRPGDNESA